MSNLRYKEGTEKVSKVLNKLRSLIVTLPDKEDTPKEMWLSKLDSIVPQAEESLSIALVGEYDVGKSSIIKVLTGENVLINSNVATSNVKIYDYLGLKLIDMPGTLSGLEDHDQLAYEAAANSDLLLYVITNELFNLSNINPFFDTLKLLKKENQCMLVVNQIDRVNLMERTIEDAIAIMLEELTVRVKPYSIDQFSPVFISSRNYIDSLTEDDEELKQELYESSRIDNLKVALNKFCDDNGINGRLLRPLQSSLTLLDSVNNFIGDENDEYNILNNYYSRQKRIFIDSENSIKSKINKLKISKKKEIMDLSIPIVKAFENKLEPDEIEMAYDEADFNLNEIIEKLSMDIEEILKTSIEELQEKLEEFDSSPITLEVKAIIDSSNINVDSLDLSKYPKKIPNLIKSNVRSGIDDVSKYLSKNADDLAKQFVEVYKQAKNVKFKPYGKIKLTDKAGKVIGKAGKALGWLAVGWDLYCNVKEEVDDAKWDKRLREFKALTKQNFKKAADNCDETITKSINQYIENEISSKINELDKKQRELINSDKSEKKVRVAINEIEDIINLTLLDLNKFA